MQVFVYFCTLFVIKRIYYILDMTIYDYIEQYSTPENEVLRFINRDTHLHVLNPHMLSGQVQGLFLSMLSKMISPRRILELGTFTGYSTLCLAEGLAEGGEIITIEHNDELEDTIRRNLSLSSSGDKVRLLIGDIKTILPTIKDTTFDLVFIDADKREYSSYLDLVYPIVRLGGWILADNTLWDGHIIDSAYDHDAQTIGLRLFNEKVAKDTRFRQVILPLRDGLSIIQKIE